MAFGELCLIDKNISSLLQVPLKSNITSVNLHCNRLTKIEGFSTAWHIRHLDLSSNHISCIEGLSSLSSLRTLNLSCNNITKVEGLVGLINLTRLNMAYNQICDLTGLLYLHGTAYKLKHLQLHSNHLDSMNHVLQCMTGLHSLRNVTLCKDGADNPVCSLSGYREIVLQALSQISTLDGADRLGKPAPSDDDSPMDVPGLEDFLEFLHPTDISDTVELVQPHAPFTTPQINKALTQFQHRGRALVTPGKVMAQLQHAGDSASMNQTNELRIKKLEQQMCQLFQHASFAQQSVIQKAKKDTDQTSESEFDSEKENQGHSRIPYSKNKAGKKLVKDSKGKQSDSETDAQKQRSSKLTAGSQQRAAVQNALYSETTASVKKHLRAGRVTPDKSCHQTEEETYRAIVEERDQERERRWKAEQAVKKLTEQVKDLQARTSEEKQLQSMALHTTDRLKELLLKERSERTALQARVDELEGRCRSTADQLREARSQEEQHKRALHVLEENISKEEAVRAKQQAEEMKRKQELENKCFVLKREVDILRMSMRQHKDHLQQLQEVHRKELASRLIPGGAEFQEAMRKEMAVVEQRHAQKLVEMKQKLADAQHQFAALEDELRMALTIEAKRFSELKEGFDSVSAELLEVKAALSAAQLKEKQSGSLMKRKQELKNKCVVLKREVDMLRVSVREHEDKLQQLQEAHRMELASRLIPGGAEFHEAVRKEVTVMEQRHAQKLVEMKQKLADAQHQYAALEDEFRMALTIEAKRFSELKEGFDRISAELLEVKAALSASQLKEKQSGSLVQELTAMVKEQKTCIAELLKVKRDAVKELKAQLHMLDTETEKCRCLSVQLELLKKEKSKLTSQITAQDSVIEGLRGERRMLGQELAQQGVSLAQDRGRLEAKIEVLTTELETQKKLNERDNDALRIKAKIVDDQTETIRKLKKALQEHEEQLRVQREDNHLAQRRFQQQLDKETAELRETVDKLSLRKEELKQQLLDKEAEMDELKEANSASSLKWRDKAELLTRLEIQVKRMKEGFDAKERALLEERNKASQAHKAAVEKLRCVDDAFRRQLESLQASHHVELLRVANEKQKQIERANHRVVQVEEEMRQLLEETESSKQAMEEKMRRLTSVLKDFLPQLHCYL